MTHYSRVTGDESASNRETSSVQYRLVIKKFRFRSNNMTMRKVGIPNRNRDIQTSRYHLRSVNRTFFGPRLALRSSQCNPDQKWTVGTTPITSLEFNPAGDRLAITSRNGYCLILRLVSLPWPSLWPSIWPWYADINLKPKQETLIRKDLKANSIWKSINR